MDKITKNQLDILQKIQEKIIISKNNEIMLRLDEIKDGPGSGITTLNNLQKENVLKVFDVKKRSGDEEYRSRFSNVSPLLYFPHREKIDLQNLERNKFLENDILEIKILPTFYDYFSNFCQENSIDMKPESMLIEILENKEIESFKTELKDKKIKWRCYVCRGIIDLINSNNIKNYLTDFRKGKYKSCKNGHRNLFKILNSKIQFLTAPFSLEELKKYKLVEKALDKENNKSKIKSGD